MPGRKRLKLSNSREVRASVGRVLNMALNGEIDSRTANTIFYGCNICLNAIRIDEQQMKLEELERTVEELRRWGF